MIPVNPIGWYLGGLFVRFTKVEATVPVYFCCEFTVKGINRDNNLYQYKLIASDANWSLKLDPDYHRPNPEIEIENVRGAEFEDRFEKIMEIKPGAFQLLALAFKQGFEFGLSQANRA